MATKMLRTTCYLILKPSYRRSTGEVEGFKVWGVLQRKPTNRGVHAVQVDLEVAARVFSPQQLKVAVSLEDEEIAVPATATPQKIQRKGACWRP